MLGKRICLCHQLSLFWVSPMSTRRHVPGWSHQDNGDRPQSERSDDRLLHTCSVLPSQAFFTALLVLPNTCASGAVWDGLSFTQTPHPRQEAWFSRKLGKGKVFPVLIHPPQSPFGCGGVRERRFTELGSHPGRTFLDRHLVPFTRTERKVGQEIS